MGSRQNDAANAEHPACTLKSCPKFNVDLYLRQLRQTLPFVPPVPVGELKCLHKVRDYGGMVRLIRHTMNVQVGLRVVWTNSGGEDSPAWVTMPDNMPFYGSKEFRELTIPMHFKKRFLEASAYDQVAIAIAHELSHVVLESLKHPLRRCEKAVDLTAMLLGFSGLYESGGRTEKRVGNTIQRSQIGYLTADELQKAYRLLTPPILRLKTRSRRALLAAGQRFAGLILLGGGIAIWAGASALYNTWEVHQKLLTEQTKAQTQLPLKLNEYTTLVGVRVGVASLTNVFSVTKPKEEINLSALEANLRKNVCASERRATIRNGASYSFEYHWDTASDIASFEIASCP